MGTLICTIELEKEKGKGITITIGNEEDKITQTLSMDGTRITLTVKKGDDAKDVSTITQTFDSVTVVAKTVTVTCTDFKVDAKGPDAKGTVTVASAKASKYTSDDTLTLSSAKTLSAESTDADVKLTGNTKVALAGGSTGTLDLEASKTKLCGGQTAIEGTQQASLKGPAIDVKASANLAMSAGASASLKGALVSLG
ncbi:MAG: hypothetical protein ABI193_15515 [Minicystis sp.]